VQSHRLSVAEALTALRSSPGGLEPAEAARRLDEFGPNDVERSERPSVLRAFLREFTHFFAFVLWVAAGLALAAELWNPGHGMGVLAGAIVAVIAINGSFSFWQHHRAERAVEALARLLPLRVEVIRGGLLEPREASELVPGDLILLEEGSRVPADCRVLAAVALRVNNATLTGESVAVGLDSDPSAEEDVKHATNVALAGTSVVSGHGRALVTATGSHTQLSRIARLAQATRPGLSPLQREITRVTRLVTLLASGLGVVFFLLGELLGLPLWSNVLFAIGIIVANVPEGLLPTITLSLAMAAQRMARQHAVVRHLPSVEALGAATVICTDKTGTLTENRMAVRRIVVAGRSHAVEADGPLLELSAAHRPFFEACWLCENIKERGGPETHELLGDPMEVALVEMARRALPGAAPPERIAEIPFDTSRRRLSTVHRLNGEFVLHTKGALQSLLPLCAAVAEDGGLVPLDAAARERVVAAESELAAQGLRVLAVAWRRVAEDEPTDALERDLVLGGLVALEDPPRRGVAEAIRRCHGAGIRVILVTGDHPGTALAIAREVGIVAGDAPRVILGDELSRLSETALQLAFDASEIVFARLDAAHKTRIVSALQRKGEVVAMTGDGVNDAPALRMADVGVAMGKSGTDAARAAADLVLADDHFATIVNAVEEGRAVYANIRKFLTYILTSNVPEVVPYLAFVLLRIPLPLTVIQILAVDLGTDMLPALALGAERAEPDVMRRPPRPRSERLLSLRLLLRAYLFLGGIQAAGALAAYFFVLFRGGWQWGDALDAADPLYRSATTACLAAIVAMQVVNVFLCRSDRLSLLRTGLRGNRLLLVGVALEVLLLLAIVYTPLGQGIFGTHTLESDVWWLLLLLAGTLLLLEELRKAIARRAAGSGGAGTR
jgi:calcium-translocating P-type ATPase